MSTETNPVQKNTTKNSQLFWIIISLITVFILSIIGFVGYRYLTKRNEASSLTTAESICKQYNLKDDFTIKTSGVLSAISPIYTPKAEMDKFNLENIISIGQFLSGYYGENSSPYNSWITRFSGTLFPSGILREYTLEDYIDNRMPFIGYLNLSHDEAKNITAKKFHQIGLCNFKQILEKSGPKYKDQLLKNGLTIEKINTRIVQSEKNDEQKNLEDLKTLDIFLTLDGPFLDSPVGVEFKPNLMYEKAFNELKPLLDDFTRFKDAENREEFIRNLQLKKSQADNSLLTNEVARLTLGYENQVVKMFNIEKDLFVTFGQINNIEFKNSKQKVYLLARDLDENKIKWILPDYYVTSVVQSSDKKTIFALAFKGFEVESITSDPGEILEIDGLTGKIKQKYNARGKFIQSINYIQPI